MLSPFLLPGRWIQFGKKKDCFLGILVSEMRVRVEMVDGDKRHGEIGRERRYLLVSGVSHQSWSRQERGAAMKKLELQCLASQIIQIMHDRQAEG
jgi:hypothetical protein